MDRILFHSFGKRNKFQEIMIPSTSVKKMTLDKSSSYTTLFMDRLGCNLRMNYLKGTYILYSLLCFVCHGIVVTDDHVPREIKGRRKVF